jgi:hypothetical protein
MEPNPYQSPRAAQDATVPENKADQPGWGVHVLVVYCVVHALVVVTGWGAYFFEGATGWKWHDSMQDVALFCMGCICPFAIVTFLVGILSLANSYISWLRLLAIDLVILFIHLPMVLIPAVY